MPPRSQILETLQDKGNPDPNISISTPSKKPIKSPMIESASKKSAPKPAPSPREEKFILVKKKSIGGGKELDVDRSWQAAYEAFRAWKDHEVGLPGAVDPSPEEADRSREEKNRSILISEITDLAASDSNIRDLDGKSEVRKMRSVVMEEALSSIPEVGKMRSVVMEEALSSIPEPGSGRVKHLVKTFESLLSISEAQEAEGAEDKKNRVMNWTLPGLQQPTKDTGSDGDRLSLESRTSSGSQRSRQNAALGETKDEESKNGKIFFKKIDVKGPLGDLSPKVTQISNEELLFDEVFELWPNSKNTGVYFIGFKPVAVGENFAHYSGKHEVKFLGHDAESSRKDDEDMPGDEDEDTSSDEIHFCNKYSVPRKRFPPKRDYVEDDVVGPFMCECNRKFKTKKGRQDHIEAKHPNFVESEKRYGAAVRAESSYGVCPLHKHGCPKDLDYEDLMGDGELFY